MTLETWDTINTSEMYWHEHNFALHLHLSANINKKVLRGLPNISQKKWWLIFVLFQNDHLVKLGLSTYYQNGNNLL